MSIYKNSLLKALGEAEILRLHLRPVKFEVGHDIELPGKPIEHLYFIEGGMASQTVTFEDGSQVEVGMFGYESVIGISALMGTIKSLNRIFTQIAGDGFYCSLEVAAAEFARNGMFHILAMRYVQAQLVQTMQSAACNAKHEVHQRLARWLLLCADRAHSNTFQMSHEYLAHMLGSSRPTVSTAAAILKEKKLITYVRGDIDIKDSAGLEAEACECYHVIKAHLNNYTEFNTGLVA